ncbi:MAG: hypothetical protein AB7I33_05460 [Gemmatimonadales bacterium]
MSARLTLLLTLLCGGLATTQLDAQATQDGTGVFINDKTLTTAELSELKRLHGVPAAVPIPAGRYWYDKYSGLWGMVGGPTQGQLLPGLEIGTMRPDVSGRGSGVFINGREIHSQEVAYLRAIFGTVVPGRYWMNWQGIGGYEGGPAIFSVYQAAQQAGRMGPGYDGYTRRTPFGSMGSDGNCSYYMSPGGSSVMTGNC